ncbi:Uncharacterised protein [Serratia marcescens]|uniref:Uncharacterized protein n=1 Tax=Serratia marcescens TaxID=615 RepID=A0A379Y3M8_SERMA|nr:Uncharacterised protein [Serratia marcescens]
MMYMLRKIPKRTDFVKYARLQVRSGGYRQLQDRPAAGHPTERQTGRRCCRKRRTTRLRPDGGKTKTSAAPSGRIFLPLSARCSPHLGLQQQHLTVHFRHHAEMALVANLRRQDFPLVEFKCAHVLDIQPSAKQGLNVLCHFQRVITLERFSFFYAPPVDPCAQRAAKGGSLEIQNAT